MNSNRFAAIGAFMAGLAVMLGAFGAHAIKDKVSPADLEIWKTGAHYHLVHAIALLALALYDKKGSYRTVCWLWIVGITIFGGSLYALVGTQVRVFGAITPIGGLCLIFGWLLLGFKLIKPESDSG
ncbi:MAG: DUF423 domain-containing protein [Armatimonadota bacterium]